jgi:membrane protease subunit (stomatin/prohibitin family)
MPGLLRGVARTAVIAGTATHVSNNVSRRQANKWAAQEAEQAPQQQQQQAAPSQDDVYVELEKLGQLKNDGIITQEEFDAKKRQLLGL